MQSFIRYIDDLQKQETALNNIKRIVEAINAVFITSFDGTELGRPNYAGQPVTKGMAKAIDDFEKTNKLYEKDANHEIIVSHWKKMWRSIAELKREVPEIITKELNRVEKNKKKSIIPHRDYDKYPDGAAIVRKLVTDFPPTGATLDELAHEFPEWVDTIDRKVKKISRKWQGLIRFTPESNSISLNPQEYSALRTLIHDFNGINELTNLAYDDMRSYWGMLLYTISPLIKDETSKEFVLQEWQKYVNKRVDEYKHLVKPKTAKILKSNGITTGMDFLKQNYYFIMDNLNLPKSEIIDLYLGFASRLKYDCADFVMEICHDSLFVDTSRANVSDGFENLRKYFDKKKITYEKILKEKDILLDSKKYPHRRVTYKIIAFIRWFSKKCKTAGISYFEPLNKSWDYAKWLTPNEKKELKIRKKSKVQETEVGNISVGIDETPNPLLQDSPPLETELISAENNSEIPLLTAYDGDKHEK